MNISNIKPSYFIFFILQDILLAMSKSQSDSKTAAPNNSSTNKYTSKRSNPDSPKPITSIDYYNSKTLDPTVKGIDIAQKDVIYISLRRYENLIRIIKGQIKLTTFQHNAQLRRTAFKRMKDFVKNHQNCLQDLHDKQMQELQKMDTQQFLQREFALMLEERMNMEQQEQEEFISNVKNQLLEDKMKEINSARNIGRLVEKKVTGIYVESLLSIKGMAQERQFKEKQKENMIRTVLSTTFLMVSNKLRKTQEDAFRQIWKLKNDFGSEEKQEADLKYKGMVLNGLKEYPRLNLKRALWNWYMVSTTKGEQLIQQASDNLVLYTNCNKITAFYRLLNSIRGRVVKVSPQMRRKVIMMNVTLKSLFNKHIKEAFLKTKQSAQSVKQKLAERMIEATKKKQINCVKLWLKNTKIKNKQFNDSAKIREIQRNILNKMALTKTGRAWDALKKWKGIPGKKNMKKYTKVKQFEKGLNEFFNSTMKRSYVAIKNELQVGQAIKKRAVIQLIATTQTGQVKMFERWLYLTSKAKLLNESLLVSNVFASLNFAIKSVSDNIFIDNKQAVIKEKALIQLFKNMSINVADTFRRWRQIAKIERMKQQMKDMEIRMRQNLTDIQKENVLKTLNSMVKLSKKDMIRIAINKFKQNRKIIDIQRNFLKRLLITKAGLVMIGFRKFQSIPQRRKDPKGYDKLLKFQRGLNEFFNSTMKRSYVAIKNELQVGQAIKKRAVIQLIATTQTGQVKMFERWLYLTSKAKLLNESLLVSNVFASLNFAIKSVSDNIFIDNKQAVIKEKALIQLFKNMSINVADTFRRWRQIAKIERMKQQMKDMEIRMRQNLTDIQKENVLKTLNSMVKLSKKDMIRIAINKFKQNRKIIDIQRNFLKRLLITKAGLVMIGFRKFQSIPQRRKDPKGYDKLLKFQRGLNEFFNSTMKRSYVAIKNELQVGQAIKKRAVIQLIATTQTGQVKMFERWLYLTSKAKLLNESSLVSNVFASLNFAIKSVSDNIFIDNKQAVIKEKALIQLFKNMSINVADTFRRWRQIAKIERMKQQMKDMEIRMRQNLTDIQKENVLKTLNSMVKLSKKDMIRIAINKFKQNRKIIDIQRNFLKRLLITKAGLVMIGFRKFQSIPQRRKDPKGYDKLLKFQRGLNEFFNSTMKRSYVAIKNELQVGQAIKKRAVIQLIATTQTGQVKMFERWLYLTSKAKLLNESLLVSNVFASLNFAIKSVSDNIFIDNKQAVIKEKALIQLFKNMSINVADTFRRWRQIAKIERMKQQMKDMEIRMRQNLTDIQKENVLKTLNSMVKLSKKDMIRIAINKFKQNRKIIDIQRNFLKRLLITKAGLVMIGFRKFQSIPQRRKDPKGYDKLLKFQRGLNEFFNSTMKRSYVAIKNELQVGQAIKKRAVIQLIATTQTGQVKMFERWLYLTSKAKLLNESLLVSNVFASLNFAIKSVSDNIFIDNKQAVIKEKALIQLFKNMSINVADTFRRWRQIAKIERMKQQMKDMEIRMRQNLTDIQKENVLKTLNSMVKLSKKDMIRIAINKFKQNRKIIDIQRNFLKRLLITKAGLVMIGFRKFQSIPQRRKDPKGYDKLLKFQRGLNEFFNSTMKRSYVAIKNELQVGQAIKKRAVIQLIATTQTGQVKMFERWLYLTSKAKLLNESLLVSNVFASLNFAIKSVSDNIFIDNKQAVIKEKALIQLFKNMSINVADTFRRWRQIAKIERMKQQMKDMEIRMRQNLTDIQKENVLKTLNSMVKLSKKDMIRIAINKFKQNRKIIDIQRNFLKRLLITKAGLVMIGFRKFQSIPQRRKDPKGYDKLLKFQRGLNEFFNSTMKRSYVAIKNELQVGQAIKKRAVIQLIATTQTGQVKMFERWLYLTSKAKLLNESLLVSNVFASLNFAIKSVSDNIFIDNKQAVIKEKALIQLFKNMSINVADTFRRWRQIAKIESIKENLANTITDIQKENVLKTLNSMVKLSKKDMIRIAINKFKQNRKIIDIQRNFLKRLLITKAGLVMIGFRKFQSIPQRRKDPKGYDKLLKFQRGLNEFFNSTMKRSYVAIKNELQVGQAIKKRAVIQLIATTQTGQVKMFERWLYLTSKAKLLNESLLVSNVFASLNFAIKSVSDNIFIDNKQAVIKEKALIQLFKNMSINVADTFRRWRQIAKIESIKENLANTITDIQKENVLKTLNSMVKLSKKDMIRIAINKFKQNRKIIDIQRNFLKRLLITKAGLVMIGFRKFQSIPQRRKDPKGYDKLLKFQRGLNEFFNSTMKRSYVAIKNELQVGQAIKKRAVIQLIATTQTGQVKMFERWLYLTSKAKLLNESLLVSNVFASLNFAIKSVSDNIFIDNKQAVIKEKALIQLFKNMSINVADTFRRWRQIAKIERMKQQMKDMEIRMRQNLTDIQKENVLKTLNSMVKLSKKDMIRIAINKFKQNRKIIDIQRNFLKRLLITKAGLVMIGFRKFQSIPQRRKDPKGYDKLLKFQRGLNEFFNSTMKRSYVAIKNELQVGQAIKKRAVIQLIATTQTGQVKMFERWLYLTSKAKLLNESLLVSNVFASLNFAIKSVSDNIFIDNKQAVIKEKALIQLFKNMSINVADTFRRWRQIAKIERMKQQMKDMEIRMRQNLTDIQKENVLKTLNSMVKLSKKDMIRIAINKFKQNRKIIDIQRNFLKRLLITKAGLVMIGFRKFQSIPQRRKDPKGYDKLLKFQRGLNEFFNSTMKRSYVAIKNELQVGQAIKKRAVIQLIATTQTGQVKMFERWLYLTSKAKLLNESLLVSNVFASLNFAIKSVSDNIFIDNKQAVIKEKALIQLFKNMSINVADTFRRWRQIAKIESIKENLANTITDIQKENVLKTLNSMVKLSKKDMIRIAINKFKQNRKIIDIQRNFLKRLLITKAGLVMIGFRKFQSIPQRRKDPKGYDKLLKFQRGLNEFFNSTMKRSYVAIKNELQVGQAIKKRAVIQLIATTQTGQVKMFERWLYLTSKAKLLNESLLVSNVFASLNFAIKSVSDNIFIDNKQAVIKEKALIQLFKNMSINVADTFRRWRQIAKIERMKQQMKDMEIRMRQNLTDIQKENVLKTLNSMVKLSKKDMIRIAINKFKQNRKIIDIQRNFLKRLLITKAGLVMIGFRKFQSIPQRRKDPKGYDKLLKFQRGLNEFFNSTMKRSYVAIKNELQVGQAIKKRAVIQLIATTQTGQVKMFERWLYLTSKAKLLNESLLVSNVFASLNFAIKSVSDNIFIDNKQAVIKEKALIQLFKNMSINVADTFRRWRQIAKIERMKQQMKDMEIRMRQNLTDIQKENVLKTLNSMVKLSKKDMIRIAINKFKQNRKIIDIQRNFLKRLLITKAGLVMIGFRKFQSIPQRRKDPKGYDKLLKFQRGLNEFFNSTMKRSYVAIKNELQVGQAIKKRAVIQLIATTQTGQVKMFERWLYLTSKAKLLNESLLVSNVFASLNFAIKSVSDNIFIDNKQAVIKEKALIQLFKNMSINVADTFRRWRQIAKIERMKQQMKDMEIRMRQNLTDIQKENVLKTLNSMVKLSKKDMIRIAINKFKQNRKIIDIQRNFLKRLLITKAGLVMIGFRKFQSIPQRRKDPKGYDKLLKFQRGLNEFFNSTMKRSYVAIKNELQVGQAIKKRAVIQLIATTQTGQVKMFERWLYLTSKAKLLNESLLVSNVFASLNFAIKSVSDNIFIDNKQAVIKEKALIQLFKNMSINVADTFRRWRQIAKIERMKQQMKDMEIRMRQNLTDIQKENVLKTLNSMVKLSKKDMIRIAINKFKQNRKIIDIQRNFLKRLLITKAGLVMIGFRKFQSIPQRRKDPKGYDKLLKFQRGLNEFFNSTMKRSYVAIKNELQTAQATKRQVIYRMISYTDYVQKRYYHRWLSIQQSNKLYERCHSLTNFFNVITPSIASNYQNIFKLKKSFTIYQIRKLQTYFNLLIQNFKQNSRDAIVKMKSYAIGPPKNKWFYQAAKLLSINSKINVQKSYWRWKQYTQVDGQVHNASANNKMKKLVNHLQKHYDVTMLKSFYSIVKAGKSGAQQLDVSKYVHAKLDNLSLSEANPKHSIIMGQESRVLMSEIDYPTPNQVYCIKMIEKIFKRKLINHLKQWQYNAQPEHKLEMIRKDAIQSSPILVNEIAKYGGLQSLSKLIKLVLFRNASAALKAINVNAAIRQRQIQMNQGLQEKIQLINRQTVIMEQNRANRQQIEDLNDQLENKDMELKDAKWTVSILTDRINSIITQRFINMIEKCWETVEFRQENEAFDALIDQANANYEKEEGIFSEQDF